MSIITATDRRKVGFSNAMEVLALLPKEPHYANEHDVCADLGISRGRLHAVLLELESAHDIAVKRRGAPFPSLAIGATEWERAEATAAFYLQQQERATAKPEPINP